MPVPAKRELNSASRRKGRWVSSGKTEVLVWGKELWDGCVAFSVVGNEGEGVAVAGLIPKGGAAKLGGRALSRAGGVVMTNTVLKHQDDTLVARISTSPDPKVDWYSCCDLSDSSFITTHHLSPSDFPLTAAFHTQGKDITLEITDITRQVLDPLTNEPSLPDPLDASIRALTASIPDLSETIASSTNFDLSVQSTHHTTRIVEKLESQNRFLTAKVAALEQICSSSPEEVAQLMAANESLKNKVKTLEDRFKTTTSTLKAEIESLQARLHDSSEANRVLQMQLDMLRDATLSHHERSFEGSSIDDDDHTFSTPTTGEIDVLTQKLIEAENRSAALQSQLDNTVNSTELLGRERSRRIEALKDIARKDHELQDLRAKLAVINKKQAEQDDGVEEKLRAKVEEIGMMQSELADMKGAMLRTEGERCGKVAGLEREVKGLRRKLFEAEMRVGEVQSMAGYDTMVLEARDKMQIEALKATRRAEEISQMTASDRNIFQSALAAKDTVIEQLRRNPLHSHSQSKIESDLRESLRKSMATIETLNLRMKDKTSALNEDTKAMQESKILKVEKKELQESLMRSKATIIALQEAGAEKELREKVEELEGQAKVLAVRNKDLQNRVAELEEENRRVLEAVEDAEGRVCELETELKKPLGRAWKGGLWMENNSFYSEDSSDCDGEGVLFRENSILREENAHLELELCRYQSRAAGAEAALAVKTAEHSLRMAELITELADTTSHYSTSEESLLTASPHYDSDTSSDQSAYPYSPKAFNNFYKYEVLRLPSYINSDEIDTSRREDYLAPLEFQAIFQMTKAEFSCLTQTERDARKRAVALL